MALRAHIRATRWPGQKVIADHPQRPQLAVIKELVRYQSAEAAYGASAPDDPGVVIPLMPSCEFSSKPQETGRSPDRMTWAELIKHLGCESTAVEGHGVEAQADWDHLRTPESYLGNGRIERFASPGGATFECRTYEFPERLRLNHWALTGEWTIGRENVMLDRTGGSIAYRFHARDAHLVLSPGANGPIPFQLRLDGEVPGPSHGVDVDEDGNGLLYEGRLYQLVRQHDTIRERTVQIRFLAPGAQAYAFTFG